MNSCGLNGLVDDNTELGFEDDAAYVNWGPEWRLPSLEQIEELCNNCSSKWTTVNGVNGRLFTGSNGTSLFLPAAGYRWEEALYNADSYGGFWSRTLYPCSPYDAWGFYFYSDHVDWVYGSRYYGFSVRAVRMSNN